MSRPIEQFATKHIVRSRLIGGYAASLGDFVRFTFSQQAARTTSDL
ncbi:hypothetical protein FHW00_001362 [Ochrobactrum sp. P6BSIII]|nr:hypothetical protein [Ochrobactrum sp. P6BSIII]